MSELEELKASNEENAKWLRNICADLRLHGDVPLTIHDLGNPDGMPNDSRDSGLSLADELWLVANALDGSIDASRQGIRARYEEEISALRAELSALRAAQPLTCKHERIEMLAHEDDIPPDGRCLVWSPICRNCGADVPANSLQRILSGAAEEG